MFKQCGLFTQRGLSHSKIKTYTNSAIGIGANKIKLFLLLYLPRMIIKSPWPSITLPNAYNCGCKSKFLKLRQCAYGRIAASRDVRHVFFLYIIEQWIFFCGMRRVCSWSKWDVTMPTECVNRNLNPFYWAHFLIIELNQKKLEIVYQLGGDISVLLNVQPKANDSIWVKCSNALRFILLRMTAVIIGRSNDKHVWLLNTNSLLTNRRYVAVSASSDFCSNNTRQC